MPFLILLIIIGMPVLEIAVFIQAGDIVGLWPTLAMIVATGLAGGLLLRIQGYGVVRRIRAQVDEGRPPVREMLDGLCIFAAGLLLLTPGFITDTIGFLLFLPPVRSLIAALVAARLVMHVATMRGGGFPSGGPGGPAAGGTVIDGEFETVRPARGDDQTPLPRREP